LPFTRSPPCNDYGKAEKSAVHRHPGEREKIARFSCDINPVNGWTGEKPEIAPSPEFFSDLAPADPGDIPPSCRRCFHCGKGGAVNIVILPDGRQRQLHRECEAAWFATHDNPHSGS
jgi:hypothetical protein